MASEVKSSPALTIWTTSSWDVVQRVLGTRVLEGLRAKLWQGEEIPVRGTVLALGTRALTALQAEGKAPKNRKLGSLRGEPLTYKKASIFLSWAPGFVDVRPDALHEIRWDSILARRHCLYGDIRPQGLGQYERVRDLDFLIQEIRKRYRKTGKRVPVTHDLETLGSDPYHKGDSERPAARILTSSWTLDAGHSYVYVVPKSGLPSRRVRKQLRWLLRCKKVALGGTNHKFDSHWLYVHWGIDVRNLSFDALLVGSLNDENRSNSLKALTCQYLPDLGGYDTEFSKKYDKARLDLAPIKDVVWYNGADTDANHRLRPHLINIIRKDKPLTRFYTRLLRRAAWAFERVERRGIHVDVDAYHKLAEKLGTPKGDKGIIPELRREFVEALPNRIRNRYSDNPSPTRPALIRDLFFSPAGLGLKPHPECLTPKTREPSTSVKDHLIRFATDERARVYIDLLKRIGSAEKTRNTYVDKWLECLRSDGKFHPEYFLFKGFSDDSDASGGADTGRTSAKFPAIQTLPKRTEYAKALRKCFPAPPGHVLLQWDYSQGELRVAADVANEPTMLAAYRKGKDLHSITAARVNGMAYRQFKRLEKEDPERHGLLRSRGKAGNFGLLYGMGEEGFQLYAFSAYNLVLTLEEAAAIRNGFFDLYSGLPVWHEHQRRWARRWGFVRSPLGRVRHLPMIHSRDKTTASKAGRQSINSPVQGTLSDLCLLAIAVCEEEFAGSNLQLVAMTHDSILGYAPIREAPYWAVAVKHVMENLPLESDFGWSPKVRFDVDVEWSFDTLADLTKMSPEELERAA